jgi:hypothetical protein
MIRSKFMDKDKRDEKKVIISVGEVTGPFQQKQALFAEALQQALENAPPPATGDIQTFRLLSVELEHGGFTYVTRTRVKLEVRDESLGDPVTE